MSGTGKWTDPEFGSDQSSLTWHKYGYSQAYDFTNMNEFWIRPTEMGEGYPSEPSMWGEFGKPIPNGINQGGLGDCWFLAAASAVAEQPERVHRFIHDQKYN